MKPTDFTRKGYRWLLYIPLKSEFKLEDVFKSKAHTVLDLEKTFTVGKPHP